MKIKSRSTFDRVKNETSSYLALPWSQIGTAPGHERACARHQCPGACDRGYFRGEGREAGEVGRWLENPRLGKLLPTWGPSRTVASMTVLPSWRTAVFPSVFTSHI